MKAKKKTSSKKSPTVKKSATVAKKARKPLPSKKSKLKKSRPKPKTAPKQSVSSKAKKMKAIGKKKSSLASKKAKTSGKIHASKAVAKNKKTNQIKTPNKPKLIVRKKEAPPPVKPLDPIFAKIRQNLLASRVNLFKMVESSQELERNVSDLTFSNEIDLASNLEGREMVFQLASRDRNGLKLIDDALFKMGHGTYGICEGCSKPISMKRLQILPLTQFCIECQALMENAT